MNQFTVYRKHLQTLKDNKASLGRVNNFNVDAISDMNHELKQTFHAMIKAQDFSPDDEIRELEWQTT